MIGAAQLSLFEPTTKPIIVNAPIVIPTPSIESLPERVRTISLHRPYAGLVAAGLKTLETRMWPWPYEAGWLVIHESKTINKDAVARLGQVGANHVGIGGVAIALVWIGGCRLMTSADEVRAMVVCEEGRWVWDVAARFPLVKPIPMVGRQKFWSTTREELLTALDLAA